MGGMDWIDLAADREKWWAHVNAVMKLLSLSNGTTARGGPRPPSRVSSILPGLWRLLSSFYILALLYFPSLHLPNAAWISLWGAFLLAH